MNCCDRSSSLIRKAVIPKQRALGLTQSAISAQIRRLPVIVGGPVFEKTLGGLTLTDRGKLILRHAITILDVNDRLLGLSGSLQDPHMQRIGIPTLYAPLVLATKNASAALQGHQVYCDVSDEIARGMQEGYLDMACMGTGIEGSFYCVSEWQEPLSWVQAPDFLASPNAPLPIICSPSLVGDRRAMNALDENGTSYILVLTGPAHEPRVSGIRAGLGFGILPTRFVPPDIVIARSSFLPELPPLEFGIYLARELDVERFAGIVELLKQIPAQGRISQRASRIDAAEI